MRKERKAVRGKGRKGAWEGRERWEMKTLPKQKFTSYTTVLHRVG